MYEISKRRYKRKKYFKIFQEALDEAKYRRIVQKVIAQAEEGDFKSQRLIIEHAQGKPVQRVDVRTSQQDSLEQIQLLLQNAGQPVEWKVIGEDDEPEEDYEEGEYSESEILPIDNPINL